MCGSRHAFEHLPEDADRVQALMVTNSRKSLP